MRLVNLTSKQLGENKDESGIQMDYTGTGKVFDSSVCGRAAFETRHVMFPTDRALGLRRIFSRGGTSAVEKCRANGNI